jgi:UDP-glucose 4-epimerase
MSKVLVTGGAGFVGAYVTRDLLAAGEEVVVYDVSIASNVLDRVVPADARDRLTLVEGELTDGWGLLAVCQRQAVDRMVHLASPLTQWVRSNPAAGVAAICGGTATVLEIARALSMTRVAWTSSISVYGPTGDTASPGRAARGRPESLYGSAKVLCEDLAAAYRRDHRVDSVGFRFPVLYGPWRARGLEASFGLRDDPIRSAARGQPVVIPKAGRTLNWLYVEDASDLLVRALRQATPPEPVFDVSGEIASMREFARLLGELEPEAPVTVEGDEPEPAAAMAAVDDHPLRRWVGWAPRHTLRDGVAKTLAAYREADAAAAR